MGLTQTDKAWIKAELATKVDLQSINKQLLKKISELETKLSSHEERLAELEEKINAKDDIISKLIDSNEIQKASIQTLKATSIAAEQYSRRTSIRISGIPVRNGETNVDILKTVEQCSQALGVPYNANNVDRAHRIAKPYKRDNIEYQAIIVKFKSFAPKRQLYNARPRGAFDQRQDNQKFSIAVDLTRDNYILLNKARELTKDNELIQYCFGDVNCRLGLKTRRDNIVFFKDIIELNKIIDELN